MVPVVETEGVHIIVEASGCDPEVISDPKKIEGIFKDAARHAKMTVKASYPYTRGRSSVMRLWTSTRAGTPILRKPWTTFWKESVQGTHTFLRSEGG